MTLRREVLPSQPAPDAILRRWAVIALVSALASFGLAVAALSYLDTLTSSMRIRNYAAQQLAETLQSTLQLEQKITVIDAPPSQVAEYSAVAIWLEHADLHLTSDDDVLQVGGAVLDGGSIVTLATDSITLGLVDGQPLMLSGGVTVSQIGTLRCAGRIWAGARYEAKREELEERVELAFYQDRAAPGRLLLDLRTVEVGGYEIPFGTGAACISASSWAGEHTFESRLWSWVAFDLDVPILVPRTDPLASTMLLQITNDLAATPATQDEYEVDAQGDATLENPPL